MTKNQIIDYLYKCAKANIPVKDAIGALFKVAKLEKSAQFMEKRAFDFITPLAILGGSLLLGGGLWGSYEYGKSTANDRIKKLEEQNKKIMSGVNANLSAFPTIGALGGGGLGYYLGTDLFPNLDPTGAKILGTATGTVGGALAGSLLSNLINTQYK